MSLGICSHCGAVLDPGEACYRNCLADIVPAGEPPEFSPGAPSPSVTQRPSLTIVAPPLNHPAEGVVMSEAPAPVVSPTGAPVLPNWVPGVAAALVAVAAGLQQVLPPHTIGFQIAGAVVALGAAFGIVSQGARRKA